MLKAKHEDLAGKTLTKFKKPALSIWVEERVRQVVAVILRDLERLVFNAVVEVLKK